jgi:hypothetical protein
VPFRIEDIFAMLAEIEGNEEEDKHLRIIKKNFFFFFAVQTRQNSHK